MDNYIQVGKIVNTHGVKGDIKILPLTDDMTRFEKLKSVFVGEEKLEIEISKVWYNKGFVMLRFKGYDDINKVIKFKDLLLYIDKKDAVDLPKDSYFIYEIIGIKVYTSEGEYLGEIKDVLQPGANDVYVVKEGSNEYLIPAIKDVVKSIDIDEKKMIIELLEGLI
ncbi:ribosome maturation factor RimM [Gottschalkia purinilytica]|uniref:Ribosome maturation factor RimM n=1 Tax=Gottschalkia purinilytica TaxID=1503 RepID=A0A0L0WBC3_GOTPU|nr:ribosome maturation factor RimM [Gottschalkia purinilytica]KNF08786.1 ribosome maturation factor RimM [Gottschalkia purinilytica]